MLGILDRGEAELPVESMRVVCDQYPTPHIPEVGMIEDSLDQPFAKSVGAVVLVDEDIA